MEDFSTPEDIMNTVGDIMSTLEGVQYTREYHDKCGGWSLRKQLNLYGSPSVLNTPAILMISLSVFMVSPTVLNTPRCTHDIPRCPQ